MSKCLVCQCTFENSECVHFLGRGTDKDPYVPQFVTHPDSLASCSPSGLGVFLPPPLDDPPAVFLGLTGSQTIQGNMTQIIFWSDALYDTDGMFAADSSSRITFNAPGLYQIELFAVLGTFATVPRQSFAIRKNAVDEIARWGLESIGAPIVAQDEFKTGDYVEALVTNHSSGNFTLLTATEDAGAFFFHFSAQFLRSL